MKLALVFILLSPLLWGNKIHVLEQVNPGVFRAAIHVTTPAGSNSANPAITWVAILEAVVSQQIETCLSEAAGTASRCTGSVLIVGSLDNEISQAEEDAIKAGTTTEYIFQLDTGSCGQTAACANTVADKKVSDRRLVEQKTYEFYGQLVN